MIEFDASLSQGLAQMGKKGVIVGCIVESDLPNLYQYCMSRGCTAVH